MDFVVPTGHKGKIKGNEKRFMYLDLARELRVMDGIPVVTCGLGTIPKGLVKELEVLEIGGQAKIIKITTLLRSARILRRVLET